MRWPAYFTTSVTVGDTQFPSSARRGSVQNCSLFEENAVVVGAIGIYQQLRFLTAVTVLGPIRFGGNTANNA
jgi:hypothetical protein